MTIDKAHGGAQSENVEHPFARLGSTLDTPSNKAQNQKKMKPHPATTEAKHISKGKLRTYCG